MRSNAAFALGGTRDTRAIPALEVLLKDGDASVVDAACSAIEQIRKPN